MIELSRLRGSERYAACSDEVVAHSRKWLRVSAYNVGNVPDAWIFGFQGSLSFAVLRKLHLRIPCGEICPLTLRWVTILIFWTSDFEKSFESSQSALFPFTESHVLHADALCDFRVA